MATTVDSHAADVFRALADPVRSAIVTHLGTRDEATVSELHAIFPISIQAISRHVKVLEDVRLVSKRPDGRSRLVRLERARLADASTWLDDRIRDLDERYLRLDRLLAEPPEGTPP